MVELLERTVRRVSSIPPGVMLKLFECYCDLQGAQVTYRTLSSPRYVELVRGFFGAMVSDSFVDNEAASRHSIARLMVVVHQALCNQIPSMEWVGQDVASMTLNDAAWLEQRSQISPERMRYWNGWAIETSSGKEFYLGLACIWTSHGQNFTEDFFLQWKQFFKKQSRPAYTLLNKMAEFMAANKEDWPAETFQHPQKVKAFFLAFMKEIFLEAHYRGLNMNSQIKTWNRFMSNCEEVFIETGRWAPPYQGGLPKPKEKRDLGHASRKKVSEDGTVVHEKLITPVPLHLTDEEAIEILFSRILKDISIVKLWATDQCSKLISRVRLRKVMAQKGTPIDSGMSTKSIAQIGQENICATFEKDGFQHSKSYVVSHFGKETKGNVAELLGLPIAYSLYPYQCLLVCEHPEITASFLDELQLHADNEDYIGYIKSDGGAKLISHKARRGKYLSEQVIKLNENSQRWIEEIIEITAPLRQALKKQGNPVWKELFITCGLGFAPPARAKQPAWNRSYFKLNRQTLETLIAQFSPYQNMMPCETQLFLERVSLSSLRSTCGVEVYLRTKSVTEMAKALGHANYNTSLLRRYLPEAILSFFQTRWIRIFQRSIICEAMKDSPYLLEATSFESMDDLHAFLKNHALKDIPHHLINPDNKLRTNEATSQQTHVYISIDVGIMTALLSLEAAVRNSDETLKICGRAKYWAEVSKSVSEEIERGHDSLLKEHLSTAKAHCNPGQMSKVIYASAA